MILQLDYPPSVNSYWRHIVVGHSPRTLISREGRLYRKRVGRYWSSLGLQPWGDRVRLSMTLWVYPPDRRKRDLDNVLKAILDSLQHAGCYGDDSQIDMLHVTRMPVAKPGSVTVSLFREPTQVIKPGK